MPPLSILIVGCGVAGPTLASFLLLSTQAASEKPHITIVERSSSSRAQGQNVDIRGTGANIIRKLGLEAAIRSSTTGEEGVQFVDEQNRVWAAFAADKSGKVQTGTSDIEILRGRLADICCRRSESISEEVRKEGGVGVEYLFGEYVEEIDQDGQKVHVRFAKSGELRSFDLVVGADGLQSRTRKTVFGEAGEEARVRRLGMYNAFFSMPKSKTDSLWRRWYHAPGRRGIMLRPSEPNDNTTTALMAVINEDDERLRNAAAEGRKGVETQKALMAEYFQDAGWESERVIREMKAADDFYYDMVAQVRMDKWSKGRVVLLGDAGYCASPISGMGTTLAFNGAYNLAVALTQHPDDHTAAFADYETSMRPLVEKAQRLPLGGPPYGAPHIIHPETAWGVWTMRAILGAIYWSGLATLMFKFAGPPANAVSFEDYEFRQPPEWKS